MRRKPKRLRRTESTPHEAATKAASDICPDGQCRSRMRRQEVMATLTLKVARSVSGYRAPVTNAAPAATLGGIVKNMTLSYRITIDSPEHHIVAVSLRGQREPSETSLTFFIPSWSPGSYLMREYGRLIRSFRAHSPLGATLPHRQTGNGTYEISWDHPDFPCKENGFVVSYEVYCHEFSVRTSHVDASHAFLHGPSLLMGILDRDVVEPKLELIFPNLWSKVTTPLRDISNKRDVFLYEADDYDHLIDCPIEIGCHETDGFLHQGREHHLGFYTAIAETDNDIKGDIKKIVQATCGYFTDTPYDNYYFMHHFVPGAFGGLEHRNSCALHYCPKKMASREGYLDYLSLVAHEYFHTWNVKRIRPRQLGPFDYLRENHCDMLWLAEGLTVFMEDFILLRAKLCSTEEYLDRRVKDIDRYRSIQGRKFHSLEQSSFNAWIKLYRPDEFTDNSTVSYYLKGGLVFLCLHVSLTERGSSIDDLLRLLWQGYKKRPHEGLDKKEVLSMIASLSDEKTAESFDLMVSTTEEIDIEGYFLRVGCRFKYGDERPCEPGFSARYEGGRVFVAKVPLDGGGHRCGLNAGDEILAVDGLRFTKADMDDFPSFYRTGRPYSMTICRLGRIANITYAPEAAPKKLESILVEDKRRLSKFLP